MCQVPECGVDQDKIRILQVQVPRTIVLFFAVNEKRGNLIGSNLVECDWCGQVWQAGRPWFKQEGANGQVAAPFREQRRRLDFAFEKESHYFCDCVIRFRGIGLCEA